jgi:hypothetical protein
LPNRLLSSAKIVKAERKRELVHSFPRRNLRKIVQGTGKLKYRFRTKQPFHLIF